MSDRFHRAAKDGYMEVLREATRIQCNAPDEDGMTPTLWAAYQGHVDALRLLVRRGGEPDKCDHYGNSALHWASANGHVNCVSFLVNFGVNLWALDNDFHSAKDRAAMGGREDILRYLDSEMGRQESQDRKHVAKEKERAVAKAEKRIKKYQQLQKVATKKAEEEEKRLNKQRLRMEQGKDDTVKTNGGMRRDSKLLYGIPSRFSEIVSAGTATKKTLTGVRKKLAKKKEDDSGEFKVGETLSDGKRSTRSLSGLRRGSEILYVTKCDDETPAAGQGQKRHVQDVFRPGALSKTETDSSVLAEDNEEDDQLLVEPPSIFERPGFGSMAFRQSISGALMSIPSKYGVMGSEDDDADSGNQGSPRGPFGDRGPGSPHGGSLGSSSLSGPDGSPTPWGIDDPLDEEDEEENDDTSPLFFFLSAYGLVDYFPRFVAEDVDLESLMLLTEDDLVGTFHMALGPRRKLVKAILDRKASLDDPGEMVDSRL